LNVSKCGPARKTHRHPKSHQIFVQQQATLHLSGHTVQLSDLKLEMRLHSPGGETLHEFVSDAERH
jgi:hypothetical protein